MRLIKILELKFGRDCKAECYFKAVNGERSLPSGQLCLWSSWHREELRKVVPNKVSQFYISVPLRNRFIHTF